ncbi:hypothetical protein GOBAR_DD11979 [Gossypium barbadense]|nr:hypothetical protein GOBAR_DD11979 [Gossypium barbadense]
MARSCTIPITGAEVRFEESQILLSSCIGVKVESKIAKILSCPSCILASEADSIDGKNFTLPDHSGTKHIKDGKDFYLPDHSWSTLKAEYLYLLEADQRWADFTSLTLQGTYIEADRFSILHVSGSLNDLRDCRILGFLYFCSEADSKMQQIFYLPDYSWCTFEGR